MNNDAKYQWTGVFSRTVNGVVLSENFTFRMDTRDELEKERKQTIELIMPSAKSFPDDEGTMAHVATEEMAPVCKVHKTPMKLHPAGTSKTTGRAYPQFWSCGIKNTDGTFCNYRPPKE